MGNTIGMHFNNIGIPVCDQWPIMATLLVPGRGFCPLGKIDPQYPLVIQKGKKMGAKKCKVSPADQKKGEKMGAKKCKAFTLRQSEIS